MESGEEIKSCEIGKGNFITVHKLNSINWKEEKSDYVTNVIFLNVF